MANVHRPRVFLDVNIGEQPAGRLTIELFTDKTPKTAENFRQLCTGEHNGLSYAKAPFHRVIDEFMIQGGDIANGDGTGTKSIYGGEYEDENLGWREMDAAGLVCSANRGKDTNGSQFFLTLEPCPHLNGKHTILGRLVSGHDTLVKISKVEVDNGDRPLEPVLIARCGELEKRSKKAAAPQPEHVMNESGASSRGRRRKSDASDDEMAGSPAPPKPRPSRRKSDNLIDEGLRGRPRQRSKSLSKSRPLSATEEEGASDGTHSPHSPAEKHKRKRSPSPSRHVDEKRTDDADAQYERRRRSLPNQYGDERYNRNYGDEARYKPSPRRNDYEYAGRRGEDRYRPSHGRPRYENDAGRLDEGGARLGGGGYDEHEPPVMFKGRGVMVSVPFGCKSSRMKD
ncbi:hypothetical protein LTR91_004131 [Friedmanniomyces endolithicus]|uniref:peptidylprolyl isomerase n=1 Tax=Friedmanniomyces endolithicus TaxID=329885 RepID=A0AAN6QZ79_9PEZI|nr:hypothetical protein LTR94_008284 [Friedmanniomyces endolithicus]KAK0792341.1 hypothetical protein LTR59_008543 [Friedmanniomyces endolithicus]KAK0815689.1 hypothetical protein LTR38_002335 [Friedmanniomyces endolithicus]KAK0821300.1 hypothetical protein LTR75_000773 [Friedmanniomyces endolithicus]KAK0873090.1 hypothetical protein LTS02_001026 [Friedmanniomyces endolithicus]